MRSVCTCPTRASRQGFSLIELLVTISIIAIVIGILIPTLPRVYDSAHRAGCQANLHSIWQGCLMHLHDHKDVFPEAKYMPDPWLSGDTNPSLNTALAGYLEGEDSKVWECPGDSDVYGYEYTNDGKDLTCLSSYTYSAGLSGQTIEGSFYVRFLGFQPDEVVVLRDFDGGSFETQAGDEVRVDFFHNDRNFIFGDGHVGALQ